MALHTKRTHVGEIALPAAFRHWHNVIGVPERFSAVLTKSPFLQKLSSGRVIEAAHITAKRDGVDAALCADSRIASHDFVAQIAGIGPQSPLVNAGVGTKRTASGWSIGSTPTATAIDLALRRTPAGLRA